MYTPFQPCFCGNRWVLFSLVTFCQLFYATHACISMQVVSVDIMHPPIYLENTSPLDLETDHPPLDNNTDPPSLYLETDHPPLDNESDPPLYLETDHPSLDNETDPTSLDVETDPPPLDHPCPEANHSPVFFRPPCRSTSLSRIPDQSSSRSDQSSSCSRLPGQSSFYWIEIYRRCQTESSSDITTKVGSL